MTETIDETWERFHGGDDSAVSDLIQHYMPLVDKVVNKLALTLPAHVDKDDLTSEGYIGLIDAIGRFDNQGYKFETYAPIRIRGQIVDSLRVNDWAPRSFRQKAKSIERVIDELTVRDGRTPTNSEVAKYIGISEDEFNETISEGVYSSPVYLDEATSEEGEAFSAWDLVQDFGFDYSSVEMETLVDALSDVLYNLTDQEQAVLALYYREGKSLREIGALLEVTESRACQIHTRTLDTIREAWSAV